MDVRFADLNGQPKPDMDVRFADLNGQNPDKTHVWLASLRAAPTHRPISSAHVRLSQNGEKSRPNAPIETNARRLFGRRTIHSWPKFGPHLHRHGHEADVRDARLLIPLARQ